jgi:uncharacterized protein (DUF433 family)
MSGNWRQRIVIDPAIHHGEPCIKGTRVPVSVIVGSVADGDTSEQILAAWPQLTGEDVKAALKFAAEAVSNADFIPLYSDGGR